MKFNYFKKSTGESVAHVRLTFRIDRTVIEAQINLMRFTDKEPMRVQIEEALLRQLSQHAELIIGGYAWDELPNEETDEEAHKKAREFADRAFPELLQKEIN